MGGLELRNMWEFPESRGTILGGILIFLGVYMGLGIQGLGLVILGSIWGLGFRFSV